MGKRAASAAAEICRINPADTLLETVFHPERAVLSQDARSIPYRIRIFCQQVPRIKRIGDQLGTGEHGSVRRQGGNTVCCHAAFYPVFAGNAVWDQALKKTQGTVDTEFDFRMSEPDIMNVRFKFSDLILFR
jgi:hypothetical protein